MEFNDIQTTTNDGYVDLDSVIPGAISGQSVSKDYSETNSEQSTSKDYSKTNIQVENVDEADITKTDGDYIYSISENNVIITDVRDPNNIKIASKIYVSSYIPEDLILYKNKIVIISTDSSTSIYENNTYVQIYNITQKEKPILLKSYELYEPYYTSRCIDNQLYVISSGYLREEDDKVVAYYKEDNQTQQIDLNDIKYLKDIDTQNQTLISTVNLDDMYNEVKVKSFLIDVSNAYISENSIYLLDQGWENDNDVMPLLKTLYGKKGVIGYYLSDYSSDYSDDYCTRIYKFDISNNGDIEYIAKAKINGETINQYSLDEQNGHLRVALYDDNGSRVAIFNEKLKEIGISSYVAKGETMYSSRFMNDKVYLVTYKTMDPLFVIDLSNEQNPRVLGQLKIPGYSTYLHPYDENHLIGIGMETEEKTNRNASGRVTSVSTNIIGMKMALFDVTDVNNPKQIANTVIGDRRTTSAILTNPKALLFSKEKNLLAIPVNNYDEDFEIEENDDEDDYDYDTIIDDYRENSDSYISEGYLVYNIDLENGFNLKGSITHENKKQKPKYYSYYTTTKLLRGLYIEDNLYTVSETAVKVNKLDTLEQISELKITE